MTTIQIINIIAIIVGPVFAVSITIWYQKKESLRLQKYQLFKTLMRCRKDFQFINQDWVDSLNLIDVVFHNNKQVVDSWHTYQELLGRVERDASEENRKYLDLLHLLAQDLGYNNIRQTDIDRFYQPAALEQQKHLENALKEEQLAFLLRNNRSFSSQQNSSEVTNEYHTTRY